MALFKMNISLRRGERIFINGAVFRVDRRVCIELLNDVTFLLEHHIMQPEDVTTPLEQLYIAIQTMLMAPAQVDTSLAISLDLIKSILLLSDEISIIDSLKEIELYLHYNKPLDALKSLRFLINSNINPIKKHGNHSMVEQTGGRDMK